MDRLAAERERSAFTWFLRSVMEDAGGSGLAGRAETLSLLSHAMGDDPVRMQSHVMRVMMHLGHSRLALGPVFNEVRGGRQNLECNACKADFIYIEVSMVSMETSAS